MPESQLTLSVGDRVVYPKQGVCRVAGIDTKEVAGQKLVFVTIKREEDGAVMMVPEGKVQSIGVRKIASKGDVAKVFTFLAEDPDKADLDWKQRKVANLDRMSQGGLQGLAEVVKGLQVLSELRPLPTKERELYDTARHLLVMEVSASLTISECDAEDTLDVALFPPGKERPKRTAADFKAPGGDDDVDGLEGDNLLSMGGELELPAEEPESASEEEPAGEDEEAEATAKPAEAPKKRGRPPKAKPPPTGEEEPQALDVPEQALAPTDAPKKRGRPPKAAAAAAAAVSVPAEEPKKRGRPPKASKPTAKPAKSGKKK